MRNVVVDQSQALVAVHAVAPTLGLIAVMPFVCALFAWQCAGAVGSRVNDFLPLSAFALLRPLSWFAVDSHSETHYQN